MIIKKRTKSTSHRILESLNARMPLSASEKAQYTSQVKGYLGEQAFDAILAAHPHKGLVLNDLLFHTRDTCYQIDCLQVTPDAITLYEVKNYSGAYHYKNGVLYSDSGHAIQDPVAQAERKQLYLYNHLLNQGHRKAINAYVVYINPDFYIYNFPEKQSVVFYGQLGHHFNQLPDVNNDARDSAYPLAEKLLMANDAAYRPTNLPHYTYEGLKKGLICPNCFSFKCQNTRQTRFCLSCGHQEKITQAISRGIAEYTLLFPELPLRKHAIYEWCGSVYSKSRIQEALKKEFTIQRAGRRTFYT